MKPDTNMDMSKVEAFAGQVVTDISATFSGSKPIMGVVVHRFFSTPQYQISATVP